MHVRAASARRCAFSPVDAARRSSAMSRTILSFSSRAALSSSFVSPFLFSERFPLRLLDGSYAAGGAFAAAPGVAAAAFGVGAPLHRCEPKRNHVGGFVASQTKGM